MSAAALESDVKRWALTCLCLTLAASVQARIWRVEKDGSGDFTVIQDALDAAAAGDSVLVGPGRFDEFREQTYQPSGPQVMVIAYVETPGIALIGAGIDVTWMGPTSHVTDIGGLNPACLLIEPGAETAVSGFAFENAQFLVNFRYRSELSDCRVNNTGTNFGLDVIEGDSVVIRTSEFYGKDSIITSSPSATRLQVLDCSFQNPSLDGAAVSIGNGATDAILARCGITGYATGVETSLGGTVTLEDVQFFQVRIAAINLSSGAITMRRCRIEAGNRFPLRVNIGRLECYDSVIGGGTLTTIATAGEMYMRNCHLLNGGALTVDSIALAHETVDLRYNWWGTTDLNTIASWIDDPNGAVLYEPILDKPVATTSESMSSFKARFGGERQREEP
jgi:hypothetical protein